MEATNTVFATVRNYRYIRNHLQNLTRQLHRYRRGNRWAARSLMAEMKVVKESLSKDVHGLCGIDVLDREQLDKNAELVISVLQDHIAKNYSGPIGLILNIGFYIGIIFLLIGLISLSAAILRFIPVARPPIDIALRWAAQPPSTLWTLGATATTAGGALVGLCK